MARVMSGAFSLLAGYGNVQFPVWVTHCSTVQCSAVGVGVGVGAGSVKEQGFTHTGGDTDRGKWTVPAPSCSQDRGVSMKAGPPA